MKLRNRLLVLLLPLLVAGQSAALTLGRVRGAAIVGQSLDVSVQIQLNADESATALCLEADVFHADARQDAGRVRVTVEPTAQANTINARVISSSFIDEPMVTVYLRAGCAQKSSRRYVLLADFPSETALPLVTPSAPAPPANLPAATTTPLAESASGNTSSSGSNGAGSSPPRMGDQSVAPQAARPPTALNAAPAAAPKAAPGVRPVVRPAARPAVRPAVRQIPPKAPAATAPGVAIAASAAAVEKTQSPKAASAATGKPRLTLDPLLGLTERVANLESSANAPATDSARDNGRDAQRMQSLEESVKALVALAAKNEASLQEMRVKVQAAEGNRVPVQWLYGLVALVLACLAAMAYLWSRLSAAALSSSGTDDWWRGARNAPAAPAAAAAAADPAAVLQEVPIDVQLSGAGKLASKPVALQAVAVDSKVESRYSSLTGLEDAPSSELDVSLVEMTESNFDQLMKSGKSHSAIRPGPLAPQIEPMPATTKMQSLPVRPINSDQLFDVRQQADFFVSLGQTDQAVQILEKQINDHGATSPLIYLDLLQIFHSLNLKTDFRQFREDFNLLFNARVPEFAAFKNEGKTLEQYPHVLAHITALWSTRKALMVIEASIFRDSLDDRSTPFDLAAFRDLLLLHAIAQSFTYREEPTSDLAPLRANMAPISKGARLSPLAGPGAAVSGFDADSTVDISLPPLSGFAEVDIALNSSGMGLLPNANATVNPTSLPSVTGVLNAPTSLDFMPPRSASSSPSESSGGSPSGSGALDLELDLDLSGLVALSATHPTPHPSTHPSTQKPAQEEVSAFSKLLKAQGPAPAPVPVPAPTGTQGAKAKSAAIETGNSGAMPQSGYLTDDLLDFDLSSESAKLTIAKPKGNQPRPK